MILNLDYAMLGAVTCKYSQTISHKQTAVKSKIW